MSLSQKKLDANRSNAKKSTGPRTPEGKKTSRFNAIIHGMFCHDLVLPGESNETFFVLRDEMLESLRPRDAAELLLVDGIVSSTWRLRRLQESEKWLHAGRAGAANEQVRRHDRLKLEEWQHRFGEDGEHADESDPPRPQPTPLPDLVPASLTLSFLLRDDDGSIERQQRYEQRLELSIHRNFRQLEKLQKRDVEETPPWMGDSEKMREEVEIPEQPGEGSKCENEPTAVPRTTGGPPVTDCEKDTQERHGQAARGTGCENEPTGEGAEKSKLNPERPSRERKSETKPKTGNAGDLGESDAPELSLSPVRRGEVR